MWKSSSTQLYLITVGFVSILGQVVVLRELNVAFYGIELIYILSLAVWLLGTAIGAAVGRRSDAPQERSINSLFIITSAALAADIVVIRGIRIMGRGVPGGYLPFETQMSGLVLAIMPLSFLTGLLFRWTAQRFLSEGRTLAEAYSLESAGGVLGGLLSTLLLIWGVQNLAAGLLCCACSLAVVSFYSWKAGRLPQKILPVAGLSIVLLLTAFSPPLDRWMTSWNHPYLIDSRDTPYGRVTLTASEEQVSVFENDALSYETETTAAEEFVQLSMLQSENPQKVLVLGGGFAGIVFELLKLPVKEVDYVEISEATVDLLRNHLPPGLASSLSDARVRITYDDPRRFLCQRRLYDAILVAMPEPMSAQNNRFYTEEFFRECSTSLTQDGVLAFPIRSAENLWTPQLLRRNKSVYAALKSVFGNVVVIPGATNIFTASTLQLTTNPDVLADRFKARRIASRLVSPQYIDYLYTNDRFRGIREILSGGTPVPNSDFQPACYGYTISLWLSKFLGGFALPDAHSFQASSILISPIFWLAIALAIVIAIARRFAAARRFISMSLAGAAGMVCETVLLLNYQNRSGVLYQDIGILLMTFMVGLALGAFAASKYMTTKQRPGKRHTWLGTALMIGMGSLNLIVFSALRSEPLGSLAFTSLMLILDGALVAAVFAFISLNKVDNRAKSMTWLYSADLVGGSVGSVAAVLFLVPVFGMLATSIIAAAVAFMGLIFFIR